MKDFIDTLRGRKWRMRRWVLPLVCRGRPCRLRKQGHAAWSQNPNPGSQTPYPPPSYFITSSGCSSFPCFLNCLSWYKAPLRKNLRDSSKGFQMVFKWYEWQNVKKELRYHLVQIHQHSFRNHHIKEKRASDKLSFSFTIFKLVSGHPGTQN